VRLRLDFCWQMFQVQAPRNTSPNQTEDGLYKDITHLGDTLPSLLFGEVGKAATDAWQRCYVGKTEVTRKALSPLKTIYDKLMGLTFIEPRVEPIAELLLTAFHSMPKRGPICGTALIMLQGLVSLLQNPQALLEHGQMILDGRKNTQGILESLVLQEFATEVNLTEDLASQENTPQENVPDEPLFDEAFVPLVIDSHGLW